MTQTENARAGDADAVKAGRHFTLEHSRDLSKKQHQPRTDDGFCRLAGPRFEHLCRQVHALGPRPMAELLAEIATATGEPNLIADRLQAYAALDAEIVRAVGGDRFAPMPLQVMP